MRGPEVEQSGEEDLGVGKVKEGGGSRPPSLKVFKAFTLMPFAIEEVFGINFIEARGAKKHVTSMRVIADMGWASHILD